MRVVKWEEFAKLPPGTIYSKRDGKRHGDGFGLWEGLYVKGTMRAPTDHYEASLVPHEVEPGNVGAELSLMMSGSACEGFEDFHYAIYERGELRTLMQVVFDAASRALVEQELGR